MEDNVQQFLKSGGSPMAPYANPLTQSNKKSFLSPVQLQGAVSLLKGKIKKDDIDTIGKFAEQVESGKGKSNLGDIGKTMQSLTENVFGKQAANWTNLQIKNAFDEVLPHVIGVS